MKKIIIALAAVAMTFCMNAASVSWNVTGSADTIGSTVYLLTSISDSYASVAELAANALSSAEIKKISARVTGTGDKLASGDSVTKTANYFFAIVSGAEATSFTYVEATGMASKVYDPNAQESSPGAYASITAANILAGTSKSFVGTPSPAAPEPTSGLLLLVGMAGLALRRKQK